MSGLAARVACGPECTCHGQEERPSAGLQPLALLGPAPESREAMLAGLVRLHRHFESDPAAGDRRILLVALMAWLRPAVEAERTRWSAEEADDRRAAEEAWRELQAQGLSELELRQLAGDR